MSTVQAAVAEASSEAVGVVRSAIDAFNKGDTEAFLGHISDDVRFWMNGSHQFSGRIEGKLAFIELVTRVAEGLSKMITLDVQNIIPAGEWVILESLGDATTTSGEAYNNRYCMLWHVEDGKINEFKEYNDSKLITDMFPES